MVPVAAPFEGIAVHVVQPPGVGRITPDPCGAIRATGPVPPPLYGFPLKFACLLLSVLPKAVAVVVPARQAYSHCASVGRRNSQSDGSSPDLRARSVSRWQNASVSAKLTLPTGRSSPAGSCAVSSPGSFPDRPVATGPGWPRTSPSRSLWSASLRPDLPQAAVQVHPADCPLRSGLADTSKAALRPRHALRPLSCRERMPATAARAAVVTELPPHLSQPP